MSRIGFIAALMLIPLGVLACGGDEEGSGDGEAAAHQEAVIRARDFSFGPDKLNVTAGAPIEVKIENTGQVAHTFTIDELDLDAEIAPSEEATVRVLASEPGELKFYCRFHGDRGMRGVVTTTREGAGTEEPTGATDEPTSEPKEDPYSY